MLGSRTRGRREPGALGMHQRLGNRLVATILNRRHGLSLTDIGPFRAIRRDVFDAAGLQELTYGLPTEMIRNVARRRLPDPGGAGRLPAPGRRRVEGFGKSSRLAAGRVAHGADRDPMSEPRVLVTAKAPRPGWVKTRLCPPFGLAYCRADRRGAARRLAARGAGCRPRCRTAVAGRRRRGAPAAVSGHDRSSSRTATTLPLRCSARPRPARRWSPAMPPTTRRS